MSRFPAVFYLLAISRLVASTTLFVANYAGFVTQLELSVSGDTYSLVDVSDTTNCGLSPSWLEIDQQTDSLFCINEEYLYTSGGSLAEYSLETAPPSITANSSAPTGPVFSTIYRPGRIALAHYTGSTVSSFDFSQAGILSQLQAFKYNLTGPVTVPARQDAPHPHQIISDPTGNFLVAPDLGSDLLRIYSISPDKLLIEETPIPVTPGMGPRHGAFAHFPCSSKTFYYLVGELANSLTAYEVVYNTKTDNNCTAPSTTSPLTFMQIYQSSSFGGLYGTEASMFAPAEIAIPIPCADATPTHLTISVRNDSTSTFDDQPSDTLATYAIDQTTGNLTFQATSPAGGKYPRHFSINANGTLVSVALQESAKVVIFPRDVESGVIGNKALATWTTGHVNPDGYSLVNVIWDE